MNYKVPFFMFLRQNDNLMSRGTERQGTAQVMAEEELPCLEF